MLQLRDRRRRFAEIVCKCLFPCLITGIIVPLQAQARPTSHALLIGIGKYSPPSGAALPPAGPGHKSDSRFAQGATWPDLHGPSTDVDAMQELLKVKYGFTDIRELKDDQATAKGIRDAISQVIADTQKGDRVVIYYSGHGSQRLDSTTTKDNHRDQTIVPADAWKGVKDIRDKELAILFDQIVYDKQAHLTAIFDSCNSGTMARGVTESVARWLPYDDDDVAKEPGAITEADLKGRIPQQGDAIILAAAGPTQSAVEAKYPEDSKVHGAFTRALIRVLQQNSQALSAVDVVSAVSSMLHADPLDFQQPSVEGQGQESLFGDPVAEHELHVGIAQVEDGQITLDIGSAAGFGVGTEFTSIEANASGEKTVVEVKSLDSPTAATVAVKSGPTRVRVGQIFEVSNLVYPQAARLIVFLPHTAPIPTASAIESTKSLFPGLKFVDDPTAEPIDFLVVQGASGQGASAWVAYGQNGRSVKPGPAAKGVAFLMLGPPQSVADRIRGTEPFKRDAFRFSDKPAGANYFLTMRLRPDGLPEYTLFDPRVLAAHKPGDYVRSQEEDPKEAEINGGENPEIVCRTDLSFPVRTGWLHDAGASATEDSIAPFLSRRILRLGKLRVWQQLPSLVSGVSDWPYHLAVVRGTDATNLTLSPKEIYQVQLQASRQELSSGNVTPKYIYLFGFDCGANPYTLLPARNTNGVAAGPPLDASGEFPTSYSLRTLTVGKPFGADTLFLLATTEKINNTGLLTNDGVIESGTRGSGLDQIMINLNDSGSRGAEPVNTTWQVLQTVVPSRP
jgi:hypothetical protein